MDFKIVCHDRDTFGIDQLDGDSNVVLVLVTGLVSPDSDKLRARRQVGCDRPSQQLSPESVVQSVAAQISQSVSVGAGKVDHTTPTNRLPAKKRAGVAVGFFVETSVRHCRNQCVCR